MDALGWLAGTDYTIAREILQRGVAALYVVAFLSAVAQFPALLGEHGLLPAPRYLRNAYARRQPTLFRLRYSDRLLRAVAWTGAALSALVVVGVLQLTPSYVFVPAFLIVWFLYLSIVNIGQTFYGFGWESLICEAGFTVAFLGAWDTSPPITVVILVRWLVFRLEFGAGMIKMRGDRSWRDLTALYYHHETQPMPNPLSRTAHLLPKWWHRVEVLGNHFAQLVVPWLLFLPQPVASIAAAVIILTQLWLVATGNFAWLNWITIVLAFAGVSDGAWRWLTGGAPTGGIGSPDVPVWYAAVALLASALLVALSWWPLRNLFRRRQLMNASFNRWHLVNAYGAFGSVTKERFEVVVEGTEDDPHDPAARWLEYGFKGKPGEVRMLPRQFAPYHLRLDWLMWFLALGSRDSPWFEVFLLRLLEADRPTLRLLRLDPFAGRPPRSVRARMYLYRFATREEKRGTGARWVRSEVGMLVPPVGLRG
ncbi:lipase maturation factor family protein [Leifsonia shinshuensis]|uniref:lipase maturation factor family protein n=1 Tax=Leifsonia shinshuensis TaxID=150026 RepID=UPI001F50E94A|nr:lipase maturation factor family protein [Leifsonia shinshuensis]MCI0158492.1 lipase maturation factor family protein [Leifsonia shinshuensis]